MRDIVQDDIFPQKNYSGFQSYYKQFNNWRHMIKDRPRIRFDGLYICKMHYMRYGVSDVSVYRPVHDVFTYKYMKFEPNGEVYQVYSIMTPAKFIQEFKKYVHAGGSHKK